MTNDFCPFKLQEGDEVFWNDPAGETRYIVIRSIDFHGAKGDSDCIISIVSTDGGCLECFGHELSQVRHELS